MPGRPFVANLDMYRKVPTDLLEGTRRGSILSTLAVFTMTALFVLETRAYLSSELITHLSLDANDVPQIRVNFNITMMDLICDYATIDAVSSLGTQQNVTQHVNKFAVDAEGVKQRYRNRNVAQNDVHQYDPHVEESIEELHADGEDAVSMDREMFEEALSEYEYVFVDFFASWCSHCRDLAATWETLAEVITEAAEAKVDAQIEHDEIDTLHPHHYSNEDYDEAVLIERPVLIAKIDCVDQQDLCMESNIRGYPTLRMFVMGEAKADYQGHRTVVELAHFITEIEEKHKANNDNKLEEPVAVEMHVVKNLAKLRTVKTEEHEGFAKFLSKSRHRNQHAWKDEEHPGCQISGFLYLDRAPGNFHIQAQSKNRDLVPHMTNVSHIINHLSFGTPLSNVFIETGLKNTPEDFYKSTRPFDGNAYITGNVHEAHHHYLKVITTEFDEHIEAKHAFAHRKKGEDGVNRAYQILQSSQLSLYRSDIVPEAKFTYDLSPIAVKYQRKSRHWYDYFTSLMAIIGGSFTVVGLFESGLYSISSKKRR